MTIGRWIEKVASRDTALVVIALCTVIATCWLYLLAGAGTGMSTWAMTSWSMAVGSPRALAMAIATPTQWTPA